MRRDEPRALRSRRVVVDEQVVPAYIVHADGRILGVTETLPANFSGDVEDLGNLVIMPGLVDTHVHINEPGRTEWEGFATATQAAAAGGITTVVDMPLNCLPVTTTAAAFATKLAEVRGKLWVNCGFWGGVTADNIADLAALLEAGVLGVKSFLIDSGIPEFPPVTWQHVDAAMPILRAFGVPYLFHAEWEGPIAATPPLRTYRDFVASRPARWEEDAIRGVIDSVRKHGTHAHIVHLAAASALSLIAEAKAEGLPLTVETCPHYLTFSAEGVDAQHKVPRQLFKCCPPIRDGENQSSLWRGLVERTIDFVVSDHSPCTPALKRMQDEDLGLAWGGIAGLQLTLPLVWTGWRQRGGSIPDLAKLICLGPTRLMGRLGATRGRMAAGCEADFVVWDPDASFQVRPEQLRHKHAITPYAEMTLRGVVHRTYLGGACVFRDGQCVGEALGKPLLRTK
jgi:allantoinase